MICVIAFFVFVVLGVFSLKYRQLAKESWECVINRVRLKPCSSGIDVKIKSQITGKLMRKSPKLARFTYKNFELLSWVLIILTVVSFGYSAYVSYNLVAYGSCDPDSGSCIFNPEEIACGSESCAERGCDCDDVGCESPEFKACEGNCSCQEQVCG